jgi:hypothetical protein
LVAVTVEALTVFEPATGPYIVPTTLVAVTVEAAMVLDPAIGPYRVDALKVFEPIIGP